MCSPSSLGGSGWRGGVCQAGVPIGAAWPLGSPWVGGTVGLDVPFCSRAPPGDPGSATEGSWRGR